MRMKFCGLMALPLENCLLLEIRLLFPTEKLRGHRLRFQAVPVYRGRVRFPTLLDISSVRLTAAETCAPQKQIRMVFMGITALILPHRLAARYLLPLKELLLLHGHRVGMGGMGDILLLPTPMARKRCTGICIKFLLAREIILLKEQLSGL